MGIYLNPSNVSLQFDMQSDIYVDKSLMISEINKLLNTNRRFVCVSRPRRFGKSMAGNMLCAYFSKGCDSREMFSKLKISKNKTFETYLNKFNVVKFDLNALYQNSKGTDTITNMETLVRNEFCKQFPDYSFPDSYGLAMCIQTVYANTGEQFVIIIDEYDVLVRERVPQALFEDYLRFLNGLFKNADLAPAFALAYLTGILPVVRDKIQSKLNLFEEYTMIDAGNLAQFIGFTAAEVKKLCKKYKMDYDECRRWYDGYSIEDVSEIFSPRSVVSAMTRKKYDSYWSQTGSYEALHDYIMMNFEGIKDDVVVMIGGGRVDVNIHSYLNTMTDFHSKDDVFTYLIHLGYLAYDQSAKQCYVPNNEIRGQWLLSVKNSPDYKEIVNLVNASRQLVESTLRGDADAVAAALAEAHMRATNPLTYNNEASMQSAIGIAYFYATAKYTIVKELPTGKGYADMVFIPYVPNTPALVVELKCDKCAETALSQIKERRYDDALQHYSGDLLFVGISYDAKTKHHACKIEKLIVG